MRSYRCCTKCKGKMPAFKCLWEGCDCHTQQMRMPDADRPLYLDRTADTAIGRLPKELRG